ncbi:SgcJ/EcaC family oxidoreductase [Actinomadura rugatobispora]|uniref:SgcJ/EcaC family oxidoreductase n=1 Tax=Actinomadura rugatobispora TaxID=1994 RepID=A0ABW1A9T9_9ACTN|nr:hypothetical protein GCM10010200_099230 [Actinomadura rugatobispora]
MDDATNGTSGSGDQGPAPDGTATVREGRALLRFERRLSHPAERVWRALTDPGEISAWLAEAQLEPRVGSRFQLRWLNAGDQEPAVARGTVTAFDPPRLLELDSDIHGTLRWELVPLPGPPPATLLVFTSDLEAPEEFIPQTLAGWHVHLDYLEKALEGARVDWPNWTTDRWQVHHDRYAESLGALEAVRDLYRRVLEGWNARDAQAFAAPFRQDGFTVGFDGTVHAGRAAIAEQIGATFADHATGSYVGKIQDVRLVGPGAAVLRAVAGMVPPGGDDLRPDLNSVQTITAAQTMGVWRVAVFHNTPAQFHGRPHLAQALTEELRETLRARRPHQPARN